jgi:hypothetical protein
MKSIPLLFCLLLAVQLPAPAQTPDPADICGRLQALLSPGPLDVNLAVALLRQINLMSAVKDPGAMTVCWPTVLQATLVPGVITQEANITLTGMGDSEPALRALVDVASTTTNDQLRTAALKLIDTKTSSNRGELRNIGIEKVAALFVTEANAWPSEFTSVSRPLNSWGPLDKLMGVAAIGDLTNDGRLEACLSTPNWGWRYQLCATVVIAGVTAKTRVMAALRSALTDLEANGGWARIQTVEGLTALVTRAGPSPLDGRDYRLSSNGGAFSLSPSYPNTNTEWTEVSGFPPEDRDRLTGALVQVLAEELDLDLPNVYRGGEIIKNDEKIMDFAPTLGKAAKPLIPHIQPFVTAYQSNKDGEQMVQKTLNLLNSF